MKPRNRDLGRRRSHHARQAGAASIDTVITSPPYYALRDYGVPGQLGLEDNVQAGSTTCVWWPGVSLGCYVRPDHSGSTWVMPTPAIAVTGHLQEFASRS